MSVSPSPTSERTESAGRAEADFTRLFNLSLDLLCIAGFDGYFRRVNPSWTRVLGWSEAELLSRPVVEFMHPDDRERTLAARAGLARGTPVQGLENRYLCKDGTYRWLAWQSVAEPGATTVFAVARDITDQRRADQEHLVLGKLEAAGVLAAGIAHDFNNLLASLTLNVDMVPHAGPITPEQAVYLQQAKRSLTSASALTGQLIALVDGGVARRDVRDLKQLLEVSLELALDGAGLRRECRLANDLWPVEVDEARIAQVIRGLVLNAREATPAGGTVRLEADNVVLPAAPAPGTPAREWVRIRVTDTGSGIAPEIVPKVFDPYFSTKQRGAQKGMGLGLTHCRVVIREHGGTIAIESRPNAGTTVTVCLPAWPGRRRDAAG
jgi:PAS domain S-box-containing protein